MKISILTGGLCGNSLKTSLNLPKIEPRPPCPPRVYSKLYAYFDRELLSTKRKRGRPRKDASTPSRPLPERHAPSLEKGLEGFRVNRTPRKGLKFGDSMKGQRLPKWVTPAIRELCAGLDAGKAVPHVIAGVESILFLPCPALEDMEGDQTMQEGQSAEKVTRGKTPALIAAVLSFAIARLTGKETNAKEYNQRVKKAVTILRDIKEDEAMVKKIGEEEESWEGWERITKQDVDEWLQDIGTQGWLRMDWWENMADGSGVSGQVEDGYGDGEDYVEQTGMTMRERQNVWVTRSGTMVQDEVDYFSEDKLERFARWKERMLVQIDMRLREGGVEP